MASKPYSPMQSPAEIAARYGDKAKIAAAVEQRIVDPTVGMLAGMVIDRIRTPQPQMPQGTVAQKVMGGGLGATPQAQQMGMAPPPPAPAPAQPMAAASGGLMDLPVDDSMFDYAGGGIVAFAGGSPGELGFDIPMSTGPDKKVLRAYYISRGLPLPDELKTPEEKAKGSKEPYPAGVFPKMGRFFSDVGTSVKDFVSPGGVDFYADPTKPGGKDIDIGFGPGRFTPPTQQGIGGMSAEQVNRLVGTTPAPQAAPAVAPQAAPQAAAPAAPFALPTKPTPQEFLRDQAAFGIDPKLNEKLLEQAEKLGGSAEDKERALAMAIIRGSLGAMAGTSPNAILNIAQGAMGGIEQYAKDTKDIRAAERDLGKLKIELAKAEDARKRGDFEGYNKRTDSANDLAIKLKTLENDTRRAIATEKQATAYVEAAGKPSSEVQLIERFMRDPKFAAAYKNVASLKAEPKTRQQAMEDWSKNILLQKQYPKFEDYYASLGGGTVADRFPGFSSKPMGQ